MFGHCCSIKVVQKDAKSIAGEGQPGTIMGDGCSLQEPSWQCFSSPGVPWIGMLNTLVSLLHFLFFWFLTLELSARSTVVDYSKKSLARSFSLLHRDRYAYTDMCVRARVCACVRVCVHSCMRLTCLLHIYRNVLHNVHNVLPQRWRQQRKWKWKRKGQQQPHPRPTLVNSRTLRVAAL